MNRIGGRLIIAILVAIVGWQWLRVPEDQAPPYAEKANLWLSTRFLPSFDDRMVYVEIGSSFGEAAEFRVPRRALAEAIRRMKGARLVIVDFLVGDSEDPEESRILAEAIRSSGNVLGYARAMPFMDDMMEGLISQRQLALLERLGGYGLDVSIPFDHVNLGDPTVLASFEHLSVLNFPYNPDQMVGGYPLASNWFDGAVDYFIPSPPVAAARLLLSSELGAEGDLTIDLEQGQWRGLIGGNPIPLNSFRGMKPRYYASKSLEMLSFEGLSEVDEDFFSGRIVWIGTSPDVAGYSIRTPVGPMSLTRLHAVLFNNLLGGDFLKEARWGNFLALMILVTGTLFIFQCILGFPLRLAAWIFLMGATYLFFAILSTIHHLRIEHFTLLFAGTLALIAQILWSLMTGMDPSIQRLRRLRRWLGKVRARKLMGPRNRAIGLFVRLPESLNLESVVRNEGLPGDPCIAACTGCWWVVLLGCPGEHLEELVSFHERLRELSAHQSIILATEQEWPSSALSGSLESEYNQLVTRRVEGLGFPPAVASGKLLLSPEMMTADRLDPEQPRRELMGIHSEEADFSMGTAWVEVLPKSDSGRVFIKEWERMSSTPEGLARFRDLFLDSYAGWLADVCSPGSLGRPTAPGRS